MVIAGRILKLRKGSEMADVPVRVLSPERDKNGWAARYEIDWPEGTRQGAARGADSIQALLFALQMVGSEIYTSDYHKSGALSWDEPGQGYGFPVVGKLRDLLQGRDAEFL
jgi:hypothetical protein